MLDKLLLAEIREARRRSLKEPRAFRELAQQQDAAVATGPSRREPALYPARTKA
jgi:hypothetical protein